MEEVVLGISMEDDGAAKKKDREGEGEGGGGGGLDLGFGFGYATSHDVDEEVICHREKIIRTEASPPFRATSAAMVSPIFTAAASASTPLPPLHPSVGFPFGNAGAVYGHGPDMFRFADRANTVGAVQHDTAARALQMQLQGSLAAGPFKSPSHSVAASLVSSGTSLAAAPPGIATALLHHPLFTPAQWQELQRQALIYKHFVSGAPVPPDLLVDTRSIHPNAAVVAPGGGFLNLRLSGSATDPEPGRCRRTDGKKWRCSRDAAPDQRYCERHLHRGRPRSRKPVERTRNKPAASAGAVDVDGGKSDSNGNNPAAAVTAATALSAAVFPTKSSATLQGSPRPFCAPALPRPDLMKLPFLSMLPEKEQQPRYLDWMKDGGIPEIIHHHAARENSNVVDIAGYRTPVLPVPILQGLPDYRQLNPALSDLNTPSYPFGNPEQQPSPRRFIDAWSTEGSTVAASSSSHDIANNQQFATAAAAAAAAAAGVYSEQLSPSTLTLSVSGKGSGRAGDYIDPDHIQMGRATNELSSSSKSQPMFGPFGGPLAEVLQSGGGVVSPRTGGGDGCGGFLGSAPATSSYTGLMNLMSRSCCSGSEGVSPRGDSSPPRVLSSPTGVLQRALVSLSDSSSNSSPRFAAGCGGARPEVVGFQWMNQNKKWW